jgi:hypothetical protein
MSIELLRLHNIPKKLENNFCCSSSGQFQVSLASGANFCTWQISSMHDEFLLIDKQFSIGL